MAGEGVGERHVAAVVGAVEGREEFNGFADFIESDGETALGLGDRADLQVGGVAFTNDNEAFPVRVDAFAGVGAFQDLLVDDHFAAGCLDGVGEFEFGAGDGFEVLEALVVGGADGGEDAVFRRGEIRQALDRPDAIGAHLDDEITAVVGEAFIDDAADAHHGVDAAGGVEGVGVEFEDVAEDVLDGGLAERAGDADDGRVDFGEAGFGALAETVLDALFVRCEEGVGGDEDEGQELDEDEP